MRALRVVGLTEDGEVVLEDPVRLERYTVPADERLRAAARGDLSRLGQIAIELESQLRPREIQARIRAGASVEQVATAAGVPEQKIERFAYPVLTERFRTADNAQRAHPMRADGPDNRTLAEVVAHTLGLRGQTYEGAKWDSWKGEDGRWVVALSWRAGRSDNRAHWVFQPGAHGGTVTALDEHASDLVEGLPARPLRTVGAVVDMTRPEEEPPPTPSPVEQWRAAASDSYRERMPFGPDPARTASRTPSEPWRPAPPPQRQTEAPVERAGTYRPTEPTPDPRPAARPDPYRSAEPLADPRPAAPRSDTVPPPTAERRADRTTAEWAPWERGVNRSGVSTAPAPPTTSAPDDQVTVPAARTAAPTPPAVTDEVTVADDTAPAKTADAAATAEEPAPATESPIDSELEAASAAAARITSAAAPAAPEPEPEQAAAEPDVPDTTVAAESTAAPSEAVADEPASAAEPAEAEAAPVAEPSESTEPAEQKVPAAAKRTRKGKPVMPSWDEVLLGVRGPR
jgi:hypothetical protein